MGWMGVLSCCETPTEAKVRFVAATLRTVLYNCLYKQNELPVGGASD